MFGFVAGIYMVAYLIGGMFILSGMPTIDYRSICTQAGLQITGTPGELFSGTVRGQYFCYSQTGEKDDEVAEEFIKLVQIESKKLCPKQLEYEFDAILPFPMGLILHSTRNNN